MDDQRDMVTVVRRSSALRMYDNENWSTMNYSMLDQRIQSRQLDSSSNIRDQNVGVDCSAVDRVWALYIVWMDYWIMIYIFVLISQFLFFSSFCAFILSQVLSCVNIYEGIMLFIMEKKTIF